MDYLCSLETKIYDGECIEYNEQACDNVISAETC